MDVKKGIDAESMKVKEIDLNEKGSLDATLARHIGGCHCGAVRFQVFAPTILTVIECNCSICTKKQNHHFIVPMSSFTLLQGHEMLKTYTFNTHEAKHIFCSRCGVQSFYIPRSNSDGYGISIYCIDPGTIKKTKVEKFDGLHWEEAIKKNPNIMKWSKK